MKLTDMFLHSKNLACLVSFLTLMFGFIPQIFGQGIFLKFEGLVTGVSGNTTWAADSGLFPSWSFNFTLLIDPSQPGTFVDSNSVTQAITTFSDPAFPGLYENAFLVNFVEGNRLWNPVFATEGLGTANYGGVTTPVDTILTDPYDPNSNVNWTNAPWGALIMAGSPPNDLSMHWVFIVDKIAAALEDADPRNWQVGETFNVYNRATLNYQGTEVGGVVTLTSITPVPEPSLISFGSLAIVVTVLARSSRLRR